MHNVIFKHVNSNMIFSKTHEKESIDFIYTSVCFENCGKSNLKCMLRRW